MGSLGAPIAGGTTLGGAVASHVYLVETNLRQSQTGTAEPAMPAVYSAGSYPVGGLPFGFKPGRAETFDLRLSTMDYVTAEDDATRPMNTGTAALWTPARPAAGT